MTYRFTVNDPMNPWFRAIELDAHDPDQAERRAEHMLFARRGVGVQLTREDP